MRPKIRKKSYSQKIDLDEIAEGVLLTDVDPQQTIKIMQVGSNSAPVANVVIPE